MVYTLPNFNLTCLVTQGPDAPSSGPTTFGPFDCQKYISSREASYIPAGTWFWDPLSPYFRIKKDAWYTQFTNDLLIWEIGFLELVPTSGIWYRIFSYEIMHEGFPNEYVVLVGRRCFLSGSPWFPGTATEDGYPLAELPPNMGPVPG